MLLKKVIQLDIFDLNYLYGSESFGKFAKTTFQDSRVGILWRILIFFSVYLKRTIDGKNKTLKQVSRRGGLLFFITGKNQFDSLQPVKEKVENAYFAAENQTDNSAVDELFPIWLAYFLSLFFFPILLIRYWKSDSIRKDSFKVNLNQYWLTYGYYFAANFWIDKLDPEVLIIANDHNMPHRVLNKVAREKGVTSVYLQHASVTDKFPPLDFDLALLEGLDALEKYQLAGELDTNVFLIGMAKNDPYFPMINTRMKLQTISICVNMLDPLERIEELCKILTGRFPGVEFYIRPHPRDNRMDWRTFAENYNMGFSNSKIEPSFDHLAKVDGIISGDSNIHLEAALMNVYPIYYDFPETGLDWYGFREHGLVDFAPDPDQLCSLIEQLLVTKPSIRERAKHYCATINTPYDGKSSVIASEIIQAVSDREVVDLRKWKRISGFNEDVFELN